MIAAPIQNGKVAAVRDLLETMNTAPGVTNPGNDLVPFDQFEKLHFARLVVLEDSTLGDLEAAYGVRRSAPPVYLAFLGDFDGGYEEFIRDLAARARDGLRRIFSFCEGFRPDTDLTAWMKAHEHRPSTYYCNWVGRTALQCREEARLRETLQQHLRDSAPPGSRSPREIYRELVTVAREKLRLTAPEATPMRWRLRHAFDILAFGALIVGGIATLPLTIIPLILLAIKLRMLEKSDAEIAPRPDPVSAAKLSAIEDHDIANQFSAMGTLKPGIFRRWLLVLILWIVDLTARIIYTKGRLARVHTIHFARWVFLDGKTRLFFASNYDGSLDSYMDDFINKVAFGLNAVFSNGIGYPQTDWLVLRGAKNEQLFKYFIRRHELPTEVWYNAHAGLTAVDLERNSLLRQGIEAPNLTETEIEDWLRLL
jgi:hypothetical protein